jgi:hypothetical protein
MPASFTASQASTKSKWRFTSLPDLQHHAGRRSGGAVGARLRDVAPNVYGTFFFGRVRSLVKPAQVPNC